MNPLQALMSLPAGSVISGRFGETETHGAIRLFRIGYSWRRYGKEFSAHTVWGIRGDAAAALANFTQRNPHVHSARVETEVL